MLENVIAWMNGVGILVYFAAYVGFTGFAFATMNILRQTKKQRMIAEFRRQRRYHQAALVRERDAHAAEIAALREQLRDQGADAKPLDAIAASRIELSKLMNGSEYRIWHILQNILAERQNAPMLWTQVPVGEVLYVASGTGTEAEQRRARQELQCKRFDFALTDKSGRLLVAIEYQGTGHWQGNATYRDAIKTAILRQADIPLLEILPDDSRAEIAGRIDHALAARRTRGGRAPARFIPAPIAAE